ncbi:alpha-(1-_3)-arabinofuranosyltransferase family protein [Aeromicrobium sp.]|uniref:alpha-(1->3)-arabinofuranosyltransferase domain-containing protein n=1 Tax=Aeromicrobium sp. TaxID=1871063 RepID=UPI0030C64BB9
MEPRDRAEEDVSEAPVRRRFRLAATCLVLTALSLVQQPGRIVADTKLDLAINPGGFLARSLDLWDADGFFGQVQNQAYGYLFPMGPFFWIGHGVQLPPWVVQRMWWALILCVAFLGMVALCKSIGIESLGVQIFAGLAFALSPRMVSVMGPSSIEVWPSAVAPWVLVPLVIGLRRGSPRRQAALSAVAVACVGGVNAVATFAVVPLGAIWLLTAPRGPRRRALMVWWPPLVLLGTFWWLVPLFLLGSVSPPFLDFIESSSVTTSAATVVDALRGTSNWVPYISSDAVAGKEFLTNAAVIVNSGVVMTLGVVGLVLAPARHRRFLVWGTLSGLFLVTLGQTGSVSGWGSGSIQTALDGVLAPLRNTHKFDVVVRIPLVLGAAYALKTAIDRGARAERTDLVRRVGASALVVAALVGATAPAWTGQLPNRRSFEVTPAYWHQTADYLARAGVGTSLMVPSSGFGDYLWGSTGDELMQPIARSPWAVRNSIPLTPTGTIRYLDAITAALDQGRGSAGLAARLRRAGIGQLVVRNDLEPEVADGRTEPVYATLRDSPGLIQVAGFGPRLGGDPMIDLETQRSFSAGGWQSTHQAVEIWQIDDPDSTTVQELSDTPTMVGGSDGLPILDDLDLIRGRSVVLAQDQDARSSLGELIVTDGLRRQEAAFGRVDTLRSASLTVEDPYTLDRRLHDYVQARDEPWISVPELRGARVLEASSSRSAVDSLVGVDPGAQPWSAFDGDGRTSWVANADTGWIRLGLHGKRDLGTVRIVADAVPGEKVRLRIGTANGVVRREAIGDQPVRVRVGRVDELRIEGDREGARPLAIADVSSTALQVSRPLVLPRTPRGWGSPDRVVLGMDEGGRPACITVEELVRCRAGAGGRSEDAVLVDRELPMHTTAAYDLAVTTRPLAGPAADAFLQEGLPLRVSASSAAAADVRNSVAGAVDGDPRTGWISEPGDTDPSLDVTWRSPRTLSRIKLTTAPGLPASRVSAVTVELDDGTRRRVALKDGEGTFAPVRVRRVVVRLSSVGDARDFGVDGFAKTLPVGVSELTFDDRPARRPDRSSAEISLPCGSGPMIRVNDRAHLTSVRTSRADVAAGRSAVARTCTGDSVTLTAGVNRVTSTASGLFDAGRSVLTSTGTPRSATGTGDLVTRSQNTNPGWQATVEGRSVTPVTVNGWQRGWRLAGTGPTDVAETYAPNASYRAALVAGALGVLALLCIALIRGSRPRPGPDVWSAGRASPVGVIAMIAVLGFTAGTIGVVCALAGMALGAWVAARREASGWTVAGPLAVAVGCYVWWAVAGGDIPVIPWRAPQLCAMASLGVVVGVLARRPGASDMNGRSTAR